MRYCGFAVNDRFSIGFAGANGYGFFMIRSIVAALSLAALVPGLTNAQEVKSGGMRVRALLLAPAGPTMELHTIAAETKKVTGPILIGARGISDSINPGSRTFSFAIPDAVDKTGYRSVAKVTLPPSGSDFIVLLEPAGETFKTHLVSGKETRFRNSSTMFFNATEVPIGATLGDNKVVIPPRKPVIAEAPAKIGDKPWYQVAFYSPGKDGKPRIFTNTRWPFRKASRCYLFFYRSTTSNRITYQAVDESIAVTKED